MFLFLTRILTISPKNVHPQFHSSICTCSFTRMENQEFQQSPVSATEFNSMKDVLRHLTQMMTVMMRKFENHHYLQSIFTIWTQQSTPREPYAPSTIWNSSIRGGGTSESRQRNEKKKAEELEKQLTQMKGADSLGSVDFNDLCIHSSLKLPSKFKCPDFEKYDGKGCP